MDCNPRSPFATVSRFLRRKQMTAGGVVLVSFVIFLQYRQSFQLSSSLILYHDLWTIPLPQQYRSINRSAYAFVIGGCDPAHPSTYQNYLSSITVATRILKRLGSQADIVALFQMSQTATLSQLPDQDVQLLKTLNVTIYYIPQQFTGQESFYRTQLDKFRILGLTQYETVLFMDGDIMPVCNLDPLLTFDQFQENVVVEGIFEPFNGGFFLLKAGYLDEVQQIIEQREAMAAALEYAHFDLQMGWGHDLTNDPWISERDTGTKWTCLAAFADQGLLYYYTKYHRKSVSVLRRNGMIHHYGWNETAVAEIGRQKSMDIVKDNPKMIRVPGKHLKLNYPFNCFVHFTGSHKPWLKGRAPNDCCIPKTKHKSAQHYWMYELSELLKGRNDVDIRTHWSKQKKKHLPPLGMFPTYSQVVNASTNVLTPLQMIGSNG